MRRESKSTTGSVVKDRRSKKWQFFWWADGRRHSKTLGHFPTKKRAWDAAQVFRAAQAPQPKQTGAPTVDGIRPDLVSPQWLDRLARSLAPIVETSVHRSPPSKPFG